jgi:hypothetical protein
MVAALLAIGRKCAQLPRNEAEMNSSRNAAQPPCWRFHKLCEPNSAALRVRSRCGDSGESSSSKDTLEHSGVLTVGTRCTTRRSPSSGIGSTSSSSMSVRPSAKSCPLSVRPLRLVRRSATVDAITHHDSPERVRHSTSIPRPEVRQRRRPFLGQKSTPHATQESRVQRAGFEFLL